MDECKIFVTDAKLKLTHRFDKGSRFNVPDGTSEFDNTHIRCLLRIVHRDLSDPFDMILNRICNMRDNLNRLPQVITLPLQQSVHSSPGGRRTSLSMTWLYIFPVVILFSLVSVTFK